MFPVAAYQLKTETIYHDWLYLQMQIIQDHFQHLKQRTETIYHDWMYLQMQIIQDHFQHLKQSPGFTS